MRRAFMLALVLTLGCGGGSGGKQEDAGVPVDPHVSLTGSVQKGPFVVGSSVSIAGLDPTGAPTGEVFQTETSDDLGEFSAEFDHVGPLSFEATGFFYQEVAGALSEAQLTLRAFHPNPSGGAQTAHINVITHLTYPRIKRLLGEGMALEAAIAQAEEELRTGLEIGPPGYDPQVPGVELDMAGGPTQANAYLLAVSAVVEVVGADLYGAGTAGIQQVLNTLGQTLADTGGVTLSTNLRLAQFELDPQLLRDHLAARFAEVGSSADPPDIDTVLDFDRDGYPNAMDCERYDKLRWTGHADLDGDGQDTVNCGGDDLDDDCKTCYPGAPRVCGVARDHDADGLVDELTGCGCVPGQPHLLGSTAQTLGRLGFVKGQVAYAVSADGLHLIDVSNPAAPAELAAVGDPLLDAVDVTVYGDRAYVLTTGGLFVVDVSNPAAPTLTSTAEVLLRADSGVTWAWSTVSRVLVEGAAATAVATDAALLVDVADPAWAVGWGAFAAPGDRGSIATRTHLYRTSCDRLYVSGLVEAALVGQVDIASSYDCGPDPYPVQVAGSVAFVGAGQSLVAVDVSDPAAPQVLGSFPCPLPVQGLAVSDGYAYVSGCNPGLTIFDVTVPAALRVAALLPAVTAQGPVFVAGDRAYVADGAVLQTVDLDCGGTVSQCGNGVVELGEECDGADESPATCPHATTACGQDCKLATPCLKVIYVNNDPAITTRNGLSWATAFANVREGVNTAMPLGPDWEVWVAEGTYYLGPGQQGFWVSSSVALYGGFAGTETRRDARHWAAHPTILDGCDSASCSNRVNEMLTAGGTGPSDVLDVVVDGFTFRNMAFFAAWPGRAIALDYTNLDVRNCSFLGDAQTISRAISVVHGKLTVRSSVFADFSSGVIDAGDTGAEITDSVFANNSEGLVQSFAALIRNCTLWQNSAAGLEPYFSQGAVVTNSIVRGTSVVLCSTYNPCGSVTYSDIQGGYTGTGNIDADPLFVDPTNGNFHLQAGSPCIDSGDGTNAPTLDYDNHPRFDDPATTNTGTGTPAFVDMGAYEYQG